MLTFQVPGNFPETLTFGKEYNIGDHVLLLEELELMYPKNEKEFRMLGRDDIKFDPLKVNTRGCPLRYPLNEEEMFASNLPGIYSYSKHRSQVLW